MIHTEYQASQNDEAATGEAADVAIFEEDLGMLGGDSEGEVGSCPNVLVG